MTCHSLTWSPLSMSAPLSARYFTTSKWPTWDAKWRGDLPPYIQSYTNTSWLLTIVWKMDTYNRIHYMLLSYKLSFIDVCSSICQVLHHLQVTLTRSYMKGSQSILHTIIHNHVMVTHNHDSVKMDTYNRIHGMLFPYLISFIDICTSVCQVLHYLQVTFKRCPI